MSEAQSQNPTPELPTTSEVTRSKWVPPQLDKLPVADTAVTSVGNLPDGIDFSS